MAVIYLTHPIHGAKVAISEEEATADSMNGWSRVTNPPVPKEDCVNEFAEPKRRGRRRAVQED